jgi:xylan 1,4-beta-xylosidase
MKRSILTRSTVTTLLAASALLSLTATSNSAGLPPAAMKHWTADNGNGTYSNPLFYGEFEDPDPIRVGDDYYLAGTTMHMMPAVEILHSKDLVNWELAGYCTNKLDLGFDPAKPDQDPYRLEGGNIYGRGICATSTAQASRSSAPNQSPGLGSKTSCPEGTTCQFSSMTTSTRSL